MTPASPPHRCWLTSRAGLPPGGAGRRLLADPAGLVPHIATSTRLRVPSLAMRLPMWVFTVLRLMCSSAAISALVRPRAMVSSTCSSRSVSGSRGWAGGAAGPVPANVDSSRRVMLGEMSESPRVAARIASPSSSGPASFSRKPVAPANSAPCTYSSRSKVVITTTATGSSTPGPASRRVASTPSRTGIRMSIRHTSGRSSRANRTASCPSRASPTTSMPSRVPRISRSPVRTRSWSSATSTRMFTPTPAAAVSR